MAPLFPVGKQVTAEAHPSKTYTLLTSVHNDADTADATDNTDDVDNYNRVIGIAPLDAFFCANNMIRHQPPLS